MIAGCRQILLRTVKERVNMMKKCACILRSAAAMVLALLFAVPAQAGPLCYDDEYIGVRSGAYREVGGEQQLDRFDLYDSDGKLCGSAMHGSYGGIVTVPKGMIIERFEDGKDRFIDTDTFEILSEYKNDYNEYTGYASDSFCVYYKKLNTLQIKDFRGNVIAETSVPETPGFDRMEHTGYMNMYRPEGAYVVHLYFNGSGFSEPDIINCIWKDGVWKFSSEPGFPETLKGEIKGTIGQYLLIGAETEDETEDDTEDEKERYHVCTQDGLIIMRDVLADLPDTWGSSLKYVGSERVPIDGGRVCFVSLQDGNTFRIFDEELNEIAVTDEDISELYTRTGYAVGLPADVLDGRVCAGTLSCGGKTLLYAREGDMIYVEGEDGSDGIPLPPDEEPVQMNDRYILAKNGTVQVNDGFSDFETDILHVWDRETGECVLDSTDVKDLCLKTGNDPDEPRSDSKTTLELTVDGILVTVGYLISAEHSGDFYVAAILDNELNLTFSTRTSKLTAGRNLSYYYESGPYVGLIDKNGNWLIKRLPYAE